MFKKIWKKSQQKEAREPSEDDEEKKKVEPEEERELSREEVLELYRERVRQKNREDANLATKKKKPADDEEEEAVDERMLGKNKNKKKGGFKLGKRGIVAIIITIVAALLLGALAVFVLPSLSGPVPTPSSQIPQQPSVQSLAATAQAWNFEFKVPKHPSEWNLSWIICWVVLGLINVLFRAESLNRSEEWDWLNVTIMLVVGWFVIISAKGIMITATEWCQYLISTDCPIKIETMDSLAIGAGIILTMVVVAIMLGSAIAAFTGRKDFTPWAMGTFSVGILIKLLVPLAAAQTFSGIIIVVGLVIYALEVGGVSKMKFETSGVIVVTIGIAIMFAMTALLTYAFGYLSGAVLGIPVLSGLLYNGRFLFGLATAWMMATGFVYMLMPSIAPEFSRISGASFVVGESDKIDAVAVLLMIVEMIFVFDLAKIFMAYM